MSAWAQARWFTCLMIAQFAASWIALAFLGVSAFVFLVLVGLGLLIAGLLLCRCPGCSKPLHWRCGVKRWPDLFLPLTRVWPEEVCSRCGTNLLAT
jgi:hypothetical protein